MRNTLQEQYNSLKEGKGNKQQFFKSARHLFPDLITPVNTFEDTVRILKNRGIITEGIGGVVTKGKTPDWHSIFKENITEAAKEAKAEEKETTKEVADMATRGYDYKDYKNIDNIYGEAFLKGFYTEMGDPKNEGKTVEELKQIVAKNMAKDCLHYTKEGQFGLKGVGYTVDAPGLGEPKPAKGKHKSSGYGDLQESVLRSQIYLLVKEVLTEENKDLSKHRLGVLKAALADAEKEPKKVGKDGKPLLDKNSKAFKDWEKTIADTKAKIKALEKEMSEGIHDKNILSNPQTNIKTPPKGVGDYDPKKRAASLKRLANMGPKPENTDESLIENTEEEKKLNALKEKALKQAGAAISSIGTNTHKVTFEHDGKTVAIAFRDSEKKAEETAEKLKKTGLLKNIKVALNK